MGQRTWQRVNVLYMRDSISLFPCSFTIARLYSAPCFLKACRKGVLQHTSIKRRQRSASLKYCTLRRKISLKEPSASTLGRTYLDARYQPVHIERNLAKHMVVSPGRAQSGWPSPQRPRSLPRTARGPIFYRARTPGTPGRAPGSPLCRCSGRSGTPGGTLPPPTPLQTPPLECMRNGRNAGSINLRPQ